MMIISRIDVVRRIVLVCVCMFVGLHFYMVPAWADETAESAREIKEKWQDAVITAKAVVEVYESERKIEVLATIIDESGLGVLSLSSIDPASSRGGSMSGQEIKIKDIKMLMPDGNEISARIVLRDQDLDLAFIRPAEKLAEPIAAVELTENLSPNIMDEIVILSRLGSTAGYVSTVSLGRINAIIRKPRTLYVPDPLMTVVCGLGTPVFSLDGRIIGMLLLKSSRSQDVFSNEMYRGMGGMPVFPVILPAAEILDVIEKAPGLN